MAAGSTRVRSRVAEMEAHIEALRADLHLSYRRRGTLAIELQRLHAGPKECKGQRGVESAPQEEVKIGMSP